MMRCQLIQTTRLTDENRAEREMLAFLSNLPEQFCVYRELQVAPAYEMRVKGLTEKKPDFVVVAPDVGVVSIEVKDWNLDRNTYEWRDQTRVCKIDRYGHEEEICNPMVQVHAYLYAFIDLLKSEGAFITSLLAFPRITRADFLNKLQNIEVLQNPQSRYYLDLATTLFSDDLDRFVAGPERLLKQAVRQNDSFRPASARQIAGVHQRLMPSAFRIGDFTKRQQHRNQLRLISEQQQRWIFGLDDDKNYLLDVAGSGKTNALISRAIHLMDKAGRAAAPRILLTTYNRNLENNIRRIFEHKIAMTADRRRYRDAITIQSIPALMEQIVASFYGLPDISTLRAGADSHADYERQLRQQVEEVLTAAPEKFRAFDHIFVDEIQDFDDFYLLVVKYLCRQDSYFFVGDIGQKIYDRKHTLATLGIISGRVEMAKSYKMHRTPKYIAELATRFVRHDPALQQEFSDHGYTGELQYPNALPYAAELRLSRGPVRDIRSCIEDLLGRDYVARDILLVTSSARLARLAEGLKTHGLPVAIGEPTTDADIITLIDFEGAKGLEREVVIITGIEDLFERTRPAALFQDEAGKRYEERLSRSKVYVALTRTLERLIVYYEDSGNRFVSELIDINSKIQKTRQRGLYAG